MEEARQNDSDETPRSNCRMVLAIGAGVGRTGTKSLQIALQHLLNGTCYHMFEVGNRADDLSVWSLAAEGEMPDWKVFLSSWSAVVDWPAAAYWREISDSFPNAPIILSLRDPEEWWQSASSTIFRALGDAKPGKWRDMVLKTLDSRFTADITNKAKCIYEYRKHNNTIKENVDKSRLVEWHPSDGWKPVCQALRLPIPEISFPHLNDRDSFKKNVLKK